MARPPGGRPTCEICQWIDVRKWRREGRLTPGQTFPCYWTIGGEPYGAISVRVEPSAVLLRFRARSYGSAEWKLVEQHVPIVWTACHLGGSRPWFCCAAYANGQYCGRRVAKLYLGGGVRPTFSARTGSRGFAPANGCGRSGRTMPSLLPGGFSRGSGLSSGDIDMPRPSQR
jgi:hypothetical protein